MSSESGIDPIHPSDKNHSDSNSHMADKAHGLNHDSHGTHATEAPLSHLDVPRPEPRPHPELHRLSKPPGVAEPQRKLQVRPDLHRTENDKPLAIPHSHLTSILEAEASNEESGAESPHPAYDAMLDDLRQLRQSLDGVLDKDPECQSRETLPGDGNMTEGEEGKSGDEDSVYTSVSAGSNDADCPRCPDARGLGELASSCWQALASNRSWNSVGRSVSGLYAMMMVLLGGVITITQTLTPSYTLLLVQVYYIYLYAMSVLFLGFLCVYMTRHQPLLQLRRALRSSRSLLSLRDSQPPTPTHEGHVHTGRQFSYDTVSTSHTSSFYLRLGALGFGIGSMIKIGLQLGEFVDAAVMAGCSDVLRGLGPMLQLVFTFLQLYLVFAYSKVCFHRWQVVVQFGMMHLLATNACVWLQNLVEGTVIDIREQMARQLALQHVTAPPLEAHEDSGYVILDDRNKTTGRTVGFLPPWDHNCNYQSRMSIMNHQSFPYLFPCSIQYSLICAGFAYVMWDHVGARHKRRGELEAKASKAKAQRMSVDCAGSSRGLFSGIFVLVLSILSLIAFYILHGSGSHLPAALRLEHATNIALLVVCSIAVVAAFWRMRGLHYTEKKGTTLEELLLNVSLCGIYVYTGFSTVAAVYHTTVYRVRGLLVASCVLHVIQASLQTLFIRSALRRQARTRNHEAQKPGKECVTFLLVANMALWVIHTFEVQETEANPVQMQFYGVLAWNIFTHLSSPLATFFRFHSSVCLSNIWKHAWKSRLRSASSMASLASDV